MKSQIRKIPECPGVYIFKNPKGQIIYIGKAANLKLRVLSYFQKSHNSRLEKLVGETKKIEYRKTGSALEALILEAELIKKNQPFYNIREKDDRSFLFAEITNEKFPRVILTRGREKAKGFRFGPFASGKSIREGLKILRRIFPYSLHPPSKKENKKSAQRPCFDFELGLCPGVCANLISEKEYQKSIRKIKLFFQSKNLQIVKELKREMKTAAAGLEFEKAQRIKKQLFALQHINDSILLSEDYFQALEKEIEPAVSVNSPTRVRIEGYDVSNISGTSAVGSMVVFENNKPQKSEYRLFRVKTAEKPNDTAMLKEILVRRFHHQEWPLPSLILIDGGKSQLKTAKSAIALFGLEIPAVSIAKGPERKNSDFLGIIPYWTDKKTLIRVRNEAHRFALNYHRKLRQKSALS